MLRRLPFLTLALLGVDALDEFAAGVPMIGAPGIEGAFDLRYSTTTLLLFSGPLALSLALEPPLFVLADRFPRKRFIVGGLLVMALGQLVVGLSSWLLPVALGLLVWPTASGAGVGLSQATLMDLHPDDRERMLTRWVFLGSLGDLAAPAMFGALAAFAWGWREAFLVSGVLVALYALLLATRPFPERSPPTDADGQSLSFRQALSAALRNRRLLLWLCASWLCSLLDELLVAFAALFLADRLGADAAERSAVLLTLMLGAVLGLLTVERFLRHHDPLRVLRVTSGACALAYLGWLLAPDLLSSAALLGATGFFAAGLYPIVKAQAYRALPGQSGMVNAVGHVFTPLDVALPFVLGLVADGLGLTVALALLIAQPVGILLLAWLPLARAPAR